REGVTTRRVARRIREPRRQHKRTRRCRSDRRQYACGVPARRTEKAQEKAQEEAEEMNVSVLVGNVLDVPADVLISTANPWLQMTGGVNLAIILRPQGELVQEELQRHLQGALTRYV